jgi:hypothetical protein
MSTVVMDIWFTRGRNVRNCIIKALWYAPLVLRFDPHHPILCSTTLPRNLYRGILESAVRAV